MDAVEDYQNPTRVVQEELTGWVARQAFEVQVVVHASTAGAVVGLLRFLHTLSTLEPASDAYTHQVLWTC